MSKKARYYFDYNATSPYAQSVIEWLGKGDFLFANPASFHASGRASRKVIHETSDYFLKFFELTSSHDIMFHSGATEGINTVVKGFAEESLRKQKKTIHFFYGPTDHSATVDLIQDLESCGHKTYPLPISGNGEISLEKVIPWMKEKAHADPSAPLMLNYTFVNNEIGVVWPLSMAEKIKEATGCFVHVDAVQAPGKIENFQKLSPTLEAYSFSGHKFGSLKGIGFSLVKKDFTFAPLIRGGGQQKGRRSGTENPMGVYSMKLAMEELQKNFQYHALIDAKLWLESKIKEIVLDEGIIVAEKANMRNANTLPLILKKGKTDLMQVAFDMAGFEISGGSACSSGHIGPNRVLQALGFEESLCKSMIRLSFSPYFSLKEAQEVLPLLMPLFTKFTR